MKEVKSYIHRSRAADVIAALKEYKLEMLCEDDEVDQIVAAMAGAARTAQSLAGWITVSDVAKVIPIH